MADRCNYFYRQKVTEAELDLGFDLLEKADRSLVSDLKLSGVVSGAVAVPHLPVANLSIDLTAPATAYDQLGQRIAYGTGQTVDCSVDLVRVPTDVTKSGNERWLAVFLRFKRQLSDPRTDGNSQQVYFRRDESFELVVRQAPEGQAGRAPKVDLQPEELLVCDIRRRFGQTQIVRTDIDTSRRQAFVFSKADAISVVTGGWSQIVPLTPNVQMALDEVDVVLDSHFAGSIRHSAAQIDCAPHGFITSTAVQYAINELADKLVATDANASGAGLIGVEALGGTPLALTAGTLRTALATLVSQLNGQSGTLDGDHFASGSNSGKHRAIHQPQLGTGRVLIFDSAASGYAYTRFRIYVDSNGLNDSVWFTLNAAWNGSAWIADSLGVNASAFRLAPVETAFHFKAGLNTGVAFTTWDASWRLPFGTTNDTAFEVSGNRIQESGRLGLQFQNIGSTTQNVTFGSTVTFRARFATAPSSVTLSPSATSPGTSASPSNISSDGFTYTVTASNLAAGSSASWAGTYSVVGS